MLAAVVCQDSPQPREIDAQDRVDRSRSRVAPELLDQSLARDGLVRVQEEKAEERALSRTTERECSPAPGDLEWPEDAELEIRMPLRRSIVRPPFREYEHRRIRLLDVFVAYSRCFLRARSS